ncbi:MAG: hypothetical protein C4345_04695 [Chloroflexota bacterium]
MRSFSAGVMSPYPAFSWMRTSIPNFSPTAFMLSTACWSQPKFVMLAGVMTATFVTFSPAAGVPSWATAEPIALADSAIKATSAIMMRNRGCLCWLLMGFLLSSRLRTHCTSESGVQGAQSLALALLGLSMPLALTPPPFSTAPSMHPGTQRCPRA